MLDPHLQIPLASLPGLSPARQERLAQFGFDTLADLLFHFPRTYEDLRDRRPIIQLEADLLQTVQGEVVDISTRSLTDGRHLTRVVLSDGWGRLEGVWFNQPHVARMYRMGQRLAFSGKPRKGKENWTISSPHVQPLSQDQAEGPGILPIYPQHDELRPEQWRPLLARALERPLRDLLPGSLRERHNWPATTDALQAIHFPTSVEEARHAKRRFLYEEFLLVQLALALRRHGAQHRARAPALPITPTIDERIRALFPFPLTEDQDQAIAEVCADLGRDRPTQRLLQADVGAGKTAVAVYALLTAVACKYQAALMAPTEVLARQHAETLEGYLARSRVRRLLLTGAMSTAERKAARAALRAGEIDLVVGTQALVQEGVEFHRLGLVVIDEGHKFGVHQRASVRRLGGDPHYLVMTATPIPRTVALTVYGDLDVSTLRRPPPGRQPITTRWVSDRDRNWVYERLREGLEAGRQVFVVCPLVEESNTLDARSATATLEELRAGAFAGRCVELLHGRQSDATRREVMDRFRRGEVDVLVCTTVVEVGVDVPNATYLVIEGAERFGLSQLHQLRGRIARGPTPGFCFVFAHPTHEEAKERLRAFVRTTDGFALAEEDARLRGVGELFGTRQHGLGDLRLGELGDDTALLDLARADARELIEADPSLGAAEHQGLRGAVLGRYGQTLELAEGGVKSLPQSGSLVYNSR